jgi:hypothetical protein
MAFLFGAPHPKHQEVKDAHSVFHGDSDLHDQRPGAMKWFQNLGSDIPAALRLAAGKFGVWHSPWTLFSLSIADSVICFHRQKQQ